MIWPNALELDILNLLVEGMSNDAIGRVIFRAEDTVKWHIARMLMRYELRNRVQLALYAIRVGFVQ